MSVTPVRHERTRGFARVLGPFFVVVSVATASRLSEMSTLLSEFTSSAVWPFVTGALALLGGLAIIGFHQVWRGLAAILVSGMGWLLVVRGIFLLAFPDAVGALAERIIGATLVWQIAYALMALIGLYLTYVGYRPTHAEHSPATTSANAGVRHAA